MKITDLTWLVKFTNGDEARMKKYTALFVQQIPTFIETTGNAIDKKDFDQVARSIHSFKAQLLYFGLKESHHLAEDIELICKRGTAQNDIKEKFLLLKDHCLQAAQELGS